MRRAQVGSSYGWKSISKLRADPSPSAALMRSGKRARITRSFCFNKRDHEGSNLRSVCWINEKAGCWPWRWAKRALRSCFCFCFSFGVSFCISFCFCFPALYACACACASGTVDVESDLGWVSVSGSGLWSMGDVEDVI